MAAPNKAQPKKQNKGTIVTAVLMLVGLAYGGVYFKDRIFPPKIPETSKPTEAWYKKQAKAPEMIRLPDAPLVLAAKDVDDGAHGGFPWFNVRVPAS